MTAVWNGWMRYTAKGSSFPYFSNSKLRCFWTANWFLHFINDVYPWQPAESLCPWHIRTYCLNGDSKHWQPFWWIEIIKAAVSRNWKKENTLIFVWELSPVEKPRKKHFKLLYILPFLILKQFKCIISINCFLGYSSATWLYFTLNSLTWTSHTV